MSSGRTAGWRIAALVPATLAAFVAFGATSALADTGTTSADSTATSHVTDGTAGTVGDPTQPQPLSGADQNDGGANGQCPDGIYCSTRDGSPSPNGVGDGNATGKPCEACVGQADNKNPPGQETSDPLGTFPNNGYECDHNNGIGVGNPAHSGCEGTTPPTTCPEGQVMDTETGECTTPGGTCPEGQVMDTETGECVTPPVTCPEGQVMDTETGECTTPPVTCPEGQVMDTETDECVTPPVTTPPVVEGEHHERTPTPPTAVEGEKLVNTPTVAPNATVLPFTGAAGLTWLLTSGGLLLALGGALVALAGRRRRTT